MSFLEMKPEILTDMFFTNMMPTLERLNQKIKITNDDVSNKDEKGVGVLIPTFKVIFVFGYKLIIH